MEKSYDLCTKCKLILDRTLKKQESELNIPLICNVRGEKPGPTVAFRNDFNTTIASNFGVVCKFIAVWLALISLSQNYEDDFSIGREYATVYQVFIFFFILSFSGPDEILTASFFFSGNRRNGEIFQRIIWSRICILFFICMEPAEIGRRRDRFDFVVRGSLFDLDDAARHPIDGLFGSASV